MVAWGTDHKTHDIQAYHKDGSYANENKCHDTVTRIDQDLLA